MVSEYEGQEDVKSEGVKSESYELDRRQRSKRHEHRAIGEGVERGLPGHGLGGVERGGGGVLAEPRVPEVVFLPRPSIIVRSVNTEILAMLEGSVMWAAVELVNPVFQGPPRVGVVRPVVEVSLEASAAVLRAPVPSVVFLRPPLVELAGRVDDSVAVVALRRAEPGYRLVSPVFRPFRPYIRVAGLIESRVPESLSVTGKGGGSGASLGRPVPVERVLSSVKLAGVADELFEVVYYDELVEAGGEGERRRASLGGLLALDRPVVVLLPEGPILVGEDASLASGGSYVTLLLLLLRELYRVSRGGLPRPLVISSGDTRRRIDDVYASNSVALIDCREPRGRCRSWEDLEGELVDRVAELFSQGYGFLVVAYRGEDEERVLKHLSNALSAEEAVHAIPAHVVKLRPLGPVRPELIDLIWGRIHLAGSSGEGGVLYDINLRSVSAERRYYWALSRIAGSPVVQVEVPVSPEEESLVHYALKGVAYLYLKYVLGYNVEAESGCGAPGVRVDVCSDDVVVEVETLYGRGLPLRRLVELVESRAGIIAGGRELWVLIPPPQASLLPRRWLDKFVEYAEGKYPSMVRLVTVDVDHALKLVVSVERSEGVETAFEGLEPLVQLT